MMLLALLQTLYIMTIKQCVFTWPTQGSRHCTRIQTDVVIVLHPERSEPIHPEEGDRDGGGRYYDRPPSPEAVCFACDKVGNFIRNCPNVHSQDTLQDIAGKLSSMIIMEVETILHIYVGGLDGGLVALVRSGEFISLTQRRMEIDHTYVISHYGNV